MTARRLSLAHLTVLDADPLTLIEAAAAGGFDAIGLRIVAPMPTDRIVPVVGDEAMIRAIQTRLADRGLEILDVEAVWLFPDADIPGYRPAFEVAERLGARHVLVVGNDPDEARVTEHFARFCELARPHGLIAMLEFIPYCHTRTLGDALRVVRASGAPNAGVLLDTLHLARSGGSAADIATLDSSLIAYAQLCDARAARPATIDALRQEARAGRRYPGEGALDLAAFVAALPAGLPLGIEAPCAEYAHLDPVERARRCGAATRAVLDSLDVPGGASASQDTATT
jgi:sugar phosphate isomerase/epimerase